MIDQLTELCKEKFKGELEGVLTLANFSCWIFFIVSWHIFHALDEISLIKGLSKVKISELLDYSSGILSSFSILELLASFLFVYSISWLSREFSEGLFYLFSLRDDFDDHMIESNKILLQLKKKNPMTMYFLGKEAEGKLSENRALYSRRRTTSQITLGASACSALGLNLATSNILVFVLFFSLFVIITWRGFYFYLENILPYYIAQKYSTGDFAAFDEGIESS